MRIKRKQKVKYAIAAAVLILIIGVVVSGIFYMQKEKAEKERDEAATAYVLTNNFYQGIIKGVGMLSQARNDYTLGYFYHTQGNCEEAKPLFQKANEEYRTAMHHFKETEKNTLLEGYEDLARDYQNLTVTEYELNKLLYKNCGEEIDYGNLIAQQKAQSEKIYGESEVRPTDEAIRESAEE